MNANALINMVMRLFLRKAINKGIDAGVDFAAKRRKDAAQQTPEEARRSKVQSQDTAKRAKQAMRLGRRIGRF